MARWSAFWRVAHWAAMMVGSKAALLDDLKAAKKVGRLVVARVLTLVVKMVGD